MTFFSTNVDFLKTSIFWSVMFLYLEQFFNFCVCKTELLNLFMIKTMCSKLERHDLRMLNINFFHLVSFSASS